MAFDYEKVTWGGGEVVSPTAADFLDHSLHLRYALEALKNVHGKVTEIGCGSARFIASVKAARPDLDTYGCDLSKAALEVAKQHHSRVHFDDAPAEKLPYGAGTFGAALMIDVLEHLEATGPGLAEVRRILEPGGVFHLVFPCEGHPLTLHGRFKPLANLKRKFAGHIQQISPTALRRLLIDAGFTIDTWKYSYHPLGQLYDLAVFGSMGLGFDTHGARHRHVESNKGGFSALKLARKAVSQALYWESRLLSKVPLGMTVHVTAH